MNLKQIAKKLFYGWEKGFWKEEEKENLKKGKEREGSETNG